MARVLIVDDEASFAAATAELLELHGFSASTALTLQQARDELEERLADILLLDVMLPDGSGLDLISELDPDALTRIVVMTAQPTLDVAIDALRARVADFLVKPVDPEELLACLQKVQRALQRATPIGPSTGGEPAFEQFVGNSPAMLEVYKLIERVAPSNASVLVRGASGTGKELVAQAIHARSERSDQPFLSLNCGTVSKELIGSELFGHERGSFTGAASQHRGYFERADGGTLFLDEITEMPQELQVQLLRVLETGKLVRVGGDKEIAIDVRIVAATNRDPVAAIESGRFRQDLYFRLAVFPITLPPLAERRGDIALLAEFFLEQLNKEAGTDKRLVEEALQRLEAHEWPGNVRELKNAVQRAFILADQEIGPADFPELGRMTEGVTIAGAAGGLKVTPGTPIDEVERHLIYATLKKFDGDKAKTADALGVSLKTLYNRLKKYREEGVTAEPE